VWKNSDLQIDASKISRRQRWWHLEEEARNKSGQGCEERGARRRRRHSTKTSRMPWRLSRRKKQVGLSPSSLPLFRGRIALRRVPEPEAVSVASGSGRGCTRLLRQKRRFGFESLEVFFFFSVEVFFFLLPKMEGASLLFPQNFFSFQHRVSCSLSLALLEEDTHFPKTMKRLEQQLRSLLGSARGGAAGGGGGEGEARGDSTTPTQTATMRPGEEESTPPSSARPLAATRFVTFLSFLFARCLPRVVVASLGVAGRQVEQESRLIAARERESGREQDEMRLQALFPVFFFSSLVQ